MTLTEDAKIGQYNIKGGDEFIINHWALHHRGDQWIEHDKFIPERFDPQSEYFLTPSGKKRHPMAFMPFLGGKRVCIGKTFSEIVSKIAGATMMSMFDFEFANAKDAEKKTPNNFIQFKEPEVYLKIRTL